MPRLRTVVDHTGWKMSTFSSSSSSSSSAAEEGDNDSCAQCGSRQSSTSNLTNVVFQINSDPKCGHRFCGPCIHDIFTNQGKRQFACKLCAAQGRSSVVKKERLSAKSLEETEAERDVRFRRRIKAIFNKSEEDFPTLQEYQDYDEEVEDIIYNLVHDIDVITTNQKIEKYRKENEETIFFNQSKQMEMRGELDRRIQLQTENLQSRLQEAHEVTARERLYKKEHAKQLNEVMLGDRDAVNMQSFLADSAATSSSSSSSAAPFAGTGAVNPAQYAPQHILAMLHPRELPKPTSSSQGKRALSNAEKRAAHMAGGYDEKNRWRRNWKEVVSHPAIKASSSAPMTLTWD